MRNFLTYVVIFVLAQTGIWMSLHSDLFRGAFAGLLALIGLTLISRIANEN